MSLVFFFFCVILMVLFCVFLTSGSRKTIQEQKNKDESLNSRLHRMV